MWRSLWHYRRLNLASLLGVAVAATVLTGALLVGDSVRMSLRALTLDRLGEIHHAAAAEHLMRARLASELDADPSLRAIGALALRGGAAAADGYASGVGIYGVEPAFATLFPDGSLDQAGLAAAFEPKQGMIFTPAVINQTLARELGVAIGDEATLSFEGVSQIHRDSLYGEKETEEVVAKLRVAVSAIIPDSGMGRFGLEAGQSAPRNLYAPLGALQRAIDQPDKINAVMIAPDGDGQPQLEAVRAAFKARMTPADLNLTLRAADGFFALETPGFFLKPAVVETASAAAEELAAPVMPVSTYLVNRIEVGDRMVPYSLMAALDTTDSLAPMRATAGSLAPGEGDMLLNQWTADDLGAAVGDTVTITYFAVGADDELTEKAAVFNLAGIVAMEGFALDRDLTPDFSGISESDDMSGWDPPFEMDMGLIRAEDEAYWDEYRAAPKAFLNPADGRRLWESRFGFETGLRMGPAPELTVAETSDRFRAALLRSLDPEQAGITIVAARERGLAASSGATDFTSLFLSMSFFIIVSAALLVGLFFRLMVERRRSEAGILLAMGYRVGAVRRRFLGEGLLIAVAGAAVGALGGALYAQGVMWALRSWWSLGTSRLHFHLEPLSLIVGGVIAVAVALISIYLTVRRVGKEPAARLIAGDEAPAAIRAGKRARVVFWISAALAALFLGAALAGDLSAGLFFGGGAALLIAGLSLLARSLAKPRAAALEGVPVRMAFRNAARRAGRSVVCASLVAFACFIIVAVGLSRHTGAVDPDDNASGTGGFFLEAESDVPLHRALDNEQGIADLGLDEELVEMLRAARVQSFRLRPGDDASCLNLYAPQQPRLLGLPESAALSGRFAFQGTLDGAGDNPWTLLEQDLEDDVVSVIADANSVMWILHSGLGQDFVIKDERGRDIKLRFVGLLQKSIFQSEIIMAERHLLRHFPSSSGFAYFLFDSDAPNRGELSGMLETALADYGMDAAATGPKLERFHEIENTYISIFQTLGGLGLLLGTLGLAAIIYRNALERRGEFAALRAFGFRRRKLAWLLLLENALLTVLGVVIGAGSATVAMLPRMLAENAAPSIPSLAITLTAVLATGLLASAWAAQRAARFPLLASLRQG